MMRKINNPKPCAALIKENCDLVTDIITKANLFATHEAVSDDKNLPEVFLKHRSEYEKKKLE